MIVDCPPEEFEYFNGTNGGVRLTLLVLQAHFLAFEVVTRPWLQASGSFRNGDSKLLRGVLDQFPKESPTVSAEMSLQLIAWPKMLVEYTSQLKEEEMRARVFATV